MNQEQKTLKEAAAEIKAVIAKHDLAAMVILQSPSNLEYVNEISPSWSAAKLSADGAFRLRARREEFPSRDAHINCLKETVGMLLSFMRQSERNAANLTEVLGIVGKHLDVAHTERWTGDETRGDVQT